MAKKDEEIKLHFFPTDEGGQGFDATYKVSDLKQRYKDICKPCWELKYCPYGPLVEGFPLPPIPKHRAIEHNEYLKKCLKDNKLADGQTLDPLRKKMFKQEVRDFNAGDYPNSVPSEVVYMSCGIFGHLCPVFFSAEGFTETEDLRRQTRSIPRDLIIRIVRRDDSTCQVCSKKLLDKDIEIDHIIPLSRGGATIESNLRILCFDCNRKKKQKIPKDFLNERSVFKNRLDHYKKGKESK